MATDHMETHSEYARRIADDGAGGLADRATIQANIADSFADLGTIYTDDSLIPSTASIRTAGTFTDAFDAKEWLETGGLIATDGTGELHPIGFVYFYQYYDEGLDEYVYEVYIDDDTS